MYRKSIQLIIFCCCIEIPRHKNQHHLIQQRSRNGYLVRHAMKQFYWGNMKKENKISGGSGDAITVAVFKDALQG